MDHHARVWQAIALPLAAPGEQDRAHAGRLADANGADVRPHELHVVVNGKARAYDATRRIYVKRDVLLGVLGLEEQHLRDHDIGHVIVYGPHDEDDPLLEAA